MAVELYRLDWELQLLTVNGIKQERRTSKSNLGGVSSWHQDLAEAVAANRRNAKMLTWRRRSVFHQWSGQGILWQLYRKRRWRDLSVLLLIDASQSTNDLVKGIGRSVLELERDATSLLAHAMDGMGDPFAIHAFCSDTREDVHYYRLKDFDTIWGAMAKRRLSGISGRFSTRMGAALRHAGRDLVSRQSYRKLLLLISDGEPSDVDIADLRYLVEDARRAVLSLQHQGIDLFCVGLDAGGDSYLTRIFGRSNVIQLDRIERLPEKLPLLYFRLAG